MTPALLYYAIPGFVVLLCIEAWFSYKENRHFYSTPDTWTSLSLGIGNVLTGFVTKAMIFGFYTILYSHRFFTIDSSSWWFWIIIFFADDFSYYWFHRTAHRVNWFWASHVVHHSSRKYNLAAALRQTWTGNATGSFIFWAWMPILGFQPIWILFMQQVSLIYQFWIHTESIKKLPAPFEFILNTPSHHRVHHGMDLKYLDKNHAGILIIWDRIFGSFQPECHTPTYGLTNNIDTYNPFLIAFTTWKDLLISAMHSGSLKNGIRYFFKPPGWSHNGCSLTVKEMRKIAETKDII